MSSDEKEVEIAKEAGVEESEELHEKLASVRLEDAASESSAPPTAPSTDTGVADLTGTTAPTASSRLQCPSPTSSSGSSSGPTVRNIPPIAKGDLAYRQQTFLARPEKTVQNSKGLGTKTVVESNYFRVKLRDMKLYQYNVEYFNEKQQPLEKPKREVTAPLFWEAVEKNSAIFPPVEKMIFNDVNVLFVKEQLRMQTGDKMFRIKREKGKRVTYIFVNIKYTGMITLAANPQTPQQKAQLVSVIDALLTMRIRCPYIKDAKYFVSNGRSMFYAPAENRALFLGKTPIVHPLGLGLESWTGFHGALKADCQDGILYNVDVGHSVFYRQSMPLIQYWLEVWHGIPISDLEAKDPGDLAINDKACFSLQSALKGMTIEMRYGNISKKFKFTMISRKTAASLTFTLDNGRQVSVEEYFAGAHNIRLRFPNMPCVKKGVNAYIPIELCYLDADPVKFKGKLKERQLRLMIQNTGYPPEQRKQIIQTLCTTTESHPEYLSESDKFMSEHGVSIEKKFIDIPATILPVPTLVYGNEKITDNAHFGVWELGNENRVLQVLEPKKTTIIAGVIFLQTGSAPPQMDLRPFEFLMLSLHTFGIHVPGEKIPFFVQKFSPNHGWNKMEDYLKEFKAAALEKDPNAKPLVIFVMPFKSTTNEVKGFSEGFSAYACMKYLCDVTVGVYCQCILEKNYTRMRGRVENCATGLNVSVKVLGKLGVEHYALERNGFHKNWTKLTDPESPTLLLGIDVTHPGPMDRKAGGMAALSVACVVGNTDLDCMQFEPSVRVQRFCEEITVSLKDEILERLIAFEKKNGKKPAHIVVYRDGISESMFDMMLYEEKRAIEEACTSMHPDYRPTLSYLVVSKRHHTRFFYTRPEDVNGDYNNMKPGTLVESAITTKTYFDFFLMSHFGALGTSRPTHYYVLWDEWAPTHSFWQTITHALCYAYVRCPRSISQPAPVAYAHLAAKRAKDYLNAFCHRHGADLDRMNDFERSVFMKRNMTKNKTINGMVFV